MILGKIWFFLVNTSAMWASRASKLIRKFYEQQHQLTSTTAFNRYPELFKEVQKNYPLSDGSVKILSYGCSTGEECFSLRQYFPKAEIVGVDINHTNLKKATKKNSDNNIRFLFSSPGVITANGAYDIIFCLSVLCRWEDTKYLSNCENVYSFQKFETTIGFLANALVAGGFLVIYNSNFKFEDTRFFKDFEVVNTPSVLDSGFVTKFDSNNNRQETPHRTCVFQKK